MTTSRPQWVLVAALCLLVAACGRFLPEGRPPGVDANSWIRISDVAGIVLTRVDAPSPVFGRLSSDSEPKERMAFPMLRQGTGVLMVKVDGAWTRIDLELPAAHLQPLR